MFGRTPGWDSLGKPGPKAQNRKAAAPLPETPPTGLTQAERAHWVELREQLRALGTTCTADAGLVRMLAKQLARLDLLQAALKIHGPVRPDGTPAPILKSIESLERTCAVNMNSLDLSPVRRRGAEMVITRGEGLGYIQRDEWVWDKGLREVLSAEDAEELEAYRFPKEVLEPVTTLDEAPDDRVGGKYRLSYLCLLTDTMENKTSPMRRLMGELWDEPDPFGGNTPAPMVSWIAAAHTEIKRGEFAGVLEAYAEEAEGEGASA